MLGQGLAPGIDENVIRPLENVYFWNKNNHPVTTSGHQYAISINAEAIWIPFLGSTRISYRPLHTIPPKVVAPANDRKIHFQSLALEWRCDVIHLATRTSGLGPINEKWPNVILEVLLDWVVFPYSETRKRPILV